jgi:hypothetical protein
MPKETFYFPHDYNARNDRKLVRVLMELGLSGIGAYWCVVEMLYEEGGYLNCSDIPMIAKELRIQVRTLENLIENFGLFEQTEEHFYSLSVLFRLSKRIARSDAARNSALSRWNSGANAMRTQSEGNAIKDKIVKDKIVKDIIPKKKYGEFQNVLLTDEEYEKLKVKFNSSLAGMIENLSAGIASKGYKYKSHYATILNWDRNQKNGGQNGKQAEPREPAPPRWAGPIKYIGGQHGTENQAGVS